MPKLSWQSLLDNLILAAGSVVMIFPFYWMFLSAFKTPAEVNTTPPTWFPSTFSFATFTRPASSVANSSITGAIIRHGPHQAAQASTNTGSGERSTSAAKDPSVTIIGTLCACSGGVCCARFSPS